MPDTKTPSRSLRMRHFNKWPLAVFATFTVTICLLAAFGHQLGMSHGALAWCQTVAGLLGMAVMAALPSILRDSDGDGIPDIFQEPEEPKPPIGGGLALLLVLVLAASSSSGCGASAALQVHAQLASLAGSVIDTGCAMVQHERDVEQRAAAEREATREAARAAVDAVRLRWDPYVFGCNLAADAQDAWAEALALFAAGGTFDLARSLALAVPVVHAWDDFLALRPPLPEGLALPMLDPNILALAATPAPAGGAQ